MTALNNKPMSLDEARKVMWLRTNYRPMGELLDEGYLNRERLKWALTKAYSPKVRQAAEVLLNWQNQSLSSPTKNKALNPSDLVVDMPIEQARATRWTFPPYKGQPMGELVDTKQLSLKDLGFAVENAWDNRVRRAATVLMLMRLNQAIKEQEAPSGFVRVISGGRSYSESRQLLLSFIQGLVGGGLMGALIVWLIFDLTLSPPNPPAAIEMLSAHPHRNVILIGAIIVLIVMIVGSWLLIKLFMRYMNWVDEQIANHRKGQEGEERVIMLMSQLLDGNWHLFRNVLLPGRQRADLDAVLVGPTGVWVLEIKNYSHEHRNIGEQWAYRIGNRWKPVRSSPSRQAKTNAIRLANFLRADGIQQWIKPVVVWANPEAPLTVENPEIPVWSLDRLPDELGNIWQGETIYEAKRQQIVDKLTKLCQRQEQSSVPE